jgi:flagellar biosynthesis activator protein FlaF
VYLQVYEQVAEETSERIRKNEEMALSHSINLMRSAEAPDADERAKVEAVFFVNRLWGVLLEDLASRENPLPEELRAKLISIGIWVLRTTEDIRRGKVHSFAGLIEVTQTIATGLAQRK